VAIVGGGTAGITVAARLRRAAPRLDVVVIEPSDRHFYQPLWTLVGAGVFPKEASMRPEADVVPRGVEWVRDAVDQFDVEANAVVTRTGRRIAYERLVVAAGIQLQWNRVAGLADAVGRGGVCSNYSYDHVAYTWECIRNFRGGRAVFTQPSSPVKCGGAPQKILYLADDAFRKNGVREGASLTFATGNNYLFQVKRYEDALYKVVQRKGVDLRLQHELVEIRPDAKEAVFRRLDADEQVVLPYDLLHVTPPMGPPDFLRDSPLASAEGWVDVDRNTLRHVRFPNVFALGDCASLPTSKTGAAIRKQAPVVVDRLLRSLEQKEGESSYDGYTSCPLVTGYGKLILAEFDYDKTPRETFPFDQSKERYSMWLLKAYGLPFLYWHGMLKGRF
jgi:sulfide:quinone oxidoreductase